MTTSTEAIVGFGQLRISSFARNTAIDLDLEMLC